MRVFVFVAVLSALIITLIAAQADDLAGGWKGTWTKDGDALLVMVRFAKRENTYSGTFDRADHL